MVETKNIRFVCSRRQTPIAKEPGLSAAPDSIHSRPARGGTDKPTSLHPLCHADDAPPIRLRHSRQCRGAEYDTFVTTSMVMCENVNLCP